MVEPRIEAVEEIGFKKSPYGTEYYKQIQIENVSARRRYSVGAIIDDSKIKFRRPCKAHFTQKDVDAILAACGDFATMLLKGNK